MVEETTTRQHEAYERIHASPEFAELKRRYLGFAFPVTVAFMVWYLLYVLASNWANDFMATEVVGNINIAFVFGLLQFVSTFLIAWLYARHASRKLDPIADRLRAQYDEEVDR
jgi:uncharacterized membrane protein (DUF485 family)